MNEGVTRETIICFNEVEKAASVYTCNKKLKNKLSQLTEERPDDCKLVETYQNGTFMEFAVPKRWVKISSPRNISEAQKAAAAERLKAYHATKGKQNV